MVIADLFTMLDKNKNGEIGKTEQEEAMKNIHSMTLPKARWTWSAMDTDGDGKISEKEFQEGMQAISDKVGEEQLVDSIIRAWTDHPLALEKAKKEKEVVLAAVKKDEHALEYAPESLKKDKEFVLAAVKQDARALAFADKSLWKDKEVESLLKDKEFVLAAVTKH